MINLGKSVIKELWYTDLPVSERIALIPYTKIKISVKWSLWNMEDNTLELLESNVNPK